MRKIIIGMASFTLSLVLAGCEVPESSLSYEEVLQRDVACQKAGGEQVYYMGKENPKAVVKSRCKVKGIEYQFYYSKYKTGPQL